jgi:hypothetical protein
MKTYNQTLQTDGIDSRAERSGSATTRAAVKPPLS